MPPLTDIDPNVGGRNSRSSNFSASTKNYGPRPSTSSSTDMVAGMLRNTTEMGDIDTFSATRGPRLPKNPRQASLRRPRHPALVRSIAPSRTSSHYSRTGSLRSIQSGPSAQDSMPGSWPYSHFPYASSQDLHSLHSNSRSSAAKASINSLPMAEPTDRSYSFTRAPFPPPSSLRPLKGHHSMKNLRGDPPQIRQRSPYVLAPHLRHQEYRPSSPTLSEISDPDFPKRQVAPPFAPGRSYASPHFSPHPSLLAHDRSISRTPPPALAQHTAMRPNRKIAELRRPFVNGSQTLLPTTDEVFVRPHGLHPPRPQNPSARPHVSRPMYRGLPASQTRRAPFQDRSNAEGTTFQPKRSLPPHPSSHQGFVQRVRNVLEEKISSEDMAAMRPELQNSNDDPDGSSTSGAPKASHGQNLRHEAVQPAINSVNIHRDDLSSATHQSSPQMKRLTKDIVRKAMDTGSGRLETSGIVELTGLESPSHSGESEVNEEEPKAKQLCQVICPVDNEEKSPLELGRRVRGDSVASEPHGPNGQITGKLGSMGSSSTISSITAASPGTSNASKSQHRSKLSESKSGSRCTKSSFASKTPSNLPSSASANNDDYDNDYERDSDLRSLEMPGQFLQSRPPSYSAEIDEDGRSLNGNETRLFSDTADTVAKGIQRQTALRSSRGSFDPTSIESSSLSPPKLDNEITFHVAGNEIVSLNDSVNERTKTPRHSADSSMAKFLFPPQPFFRETIEDSLASDVTIRGIPASSGTRPSALRTLQLPLPEVIEDSQEDASATNLHMLGAGKSRLRSRIPKHYRARSRLWPRVAPAQQPHRTYLGRTMSENRNLPALDFSRQDLTTKLNDALGLRGSKSLEDLGLPKPTDWIQSSCERQGAPDVSRPRYKSFFSPENDRAGCGRCGESAMSTPETDPVMPATQSAVKVNDDLVREIGQLSIPSVRNLTLRLSRLLPSIKGDNSEVNLATVDDAVAETVQEIRDLGSPERLASMDLDQDISDRASVGAGGLPRQTLSEESEDTAFSRDKKQQKEKTYLRLMKELPPVPMNEEDNLLITRSPSEPATSRAKPGEEKRNAAMYQPDVCSIGSSENAGKSKTVIKSLQDMPSTPSASGTPRPWNHQESYPWSGATPPVSLTKRQREEGAEKQFGASRIKFRRTRSQDDFSMDGTERVFRSMSPGIKSDAQLIPKQDLSRVRRQPEEGDEGEMVGSLKRKMGIRRRDKTAVALDLNFLQGEDHTATTSRPVNPGDRYPTSSLTPPGALNIDESRSYFSDDSSESERVYGLRKRLTRLRGKRSVPGNTSPADSRSDGHGTINKSASVLNDARVEFEYANIFQQDGAPTGMSKTEFRAKKLVEKLRTLLYKSGEMIRNLHWTRKQQTSGCQERAGVYDGV